MILPVELRCEYLIRPLGVDVAQPRLSWTLWSDRRGQKQTAYRVLVATRAELLEAETADLWDSGRVDSEQTCHIVYAGKPLSSLQRCYWKVRVWDAKGEPSDWSETSWWEMGMLHPGDWQAKWIMAPFSEPAPLFRKEFTAKGRVQRARAVICGLGYYELYLNGKRIGEQVLDPAQTDYEQRAFYVVHDVTPLLREGANCVGVMLGNGWYNQSVVWGGMAYGEPLLLFQMLLEYEDGSTALVCGDETWTTAPGPVTRNNVYAGEDYDARQEIPGWSEPGSPAGKWRSVQVAGAPTLRLQSQMLPPIRRTRLLPTTLLTNPQPGTWIFDMGQNFAGWARLKVEAPRGTTITLRFAEALKSDGTLDPESTGVFATYVVQTDRYTCKGDGVEVWEPRFTYHGFRYVEMTGYPGTPTPDMLDGVVVHTAVPPAGVFECSDEMLNRIHRTAVWTEISNLHGVPTDCPHRERCGWLGDAHVSAEMTIYNFEMAPFWAKYLEDIETSLTERGIPSFVAPGKRKIGEASPDWGTAIVQIPWYLYLYYGDERVLQRHYHTMKRWIQHLQDIARDYIVSAGLGDWFAPGSMAGNTPIPLTSTAIFYWDASLMAKTARVLGIEEDARSFERLAQQVKQAFIAQFYDSRAHTFGSQTANALALAWGLAPEGKEQAIADSLARDVVERHAGHHSTGILGSRYLYWALSEYGHGDVAVVVLRQHDYPSIGDLFRRGATTFWEHWGEAFLDEQEGPRSYNHPMQGGFDAWFFYGIAGIRPSEEAPGFKHIILKPQIVPGIEWARASYRSIRGVIVSEWQREGNLLRWRLKVPPGSTATAYFPVSRSEAIRESQRFPSDPPALRDETIVATAPIAVRLLSGDYEFEVGMP